jgi:putative hydrolase of the HAD superfamily
MRAVVFDVDDTLYLERDYVQSGFAAVGRWAASALDITGFADAAWGAFECGRRGDVFDLVLESNGFVAAHHVPLMVELYRAHVPSIGLEPDARECLDALDGRALLAIVTDGPSRSQRAKLAALGMTDRAEVVVLTDELGPGHAKPDPLAFEMVESRLGLAGSRCTYVADNPTKDFAAPRALGWRTVRIRRSGGLHTHLPSTSDVDEELQDLRALASVTR